MKYQVAMNNTQEKLFYQMNTMTAMLYMSRYSNNNWYVSLR